MLVVDDSADVRELLAAQLPARGIEVALCATAEEALLQLEKADFATILVDLQLPGLSGVELCERVVANRPEVPVVILTGHGSLDTAVAAMRAGAYDFQTKPIQIDTLVFALERALHHRGMNVEIQRLRRESERVGSVGALIGASPAMLELFDLIGRIGDSESSVLICGESGSGKELVARALHERGRRAAGPFVATNCAAVPETLLESELFGHVRGAFTDAHADRTGLFMQAHGGTLFLDEVADMPRALQPKLLRALQERAIRPVGGGEERGFDARIIAATNRDLEDEVAAGRFREDLYFRLAVIPIALPPLRARGGDVLLLADHLLVQLAARIGKPVRAISRPAAERLLAYAWPGNVRELHNCIEHAVALARFDHILVEDLPEKIRDYTVSHVLPPSDDPADLVSMDEVERRYIKRVLQVVGGNKSTAARILGYDRKTLYRRLERYGLEPSEE